MNPQRIQLSRAKGARLPPNTVSVARPSAWGNPWRVGVDGDAAYCVEQYERVLRGVPVVAWPKDEPQRSRAINFSPDAVADWELNGKNLACWCKLRAPCHADVLLRVANPELQWN